MAKWFFILSLITLAIACQKHNIEQIPPAYNSNYFPIDSGIWRQYDITQITIDEPSKIWDTNKYQLREVYAGFILDATNNPTMRIERYARDSSHQTWSTLGVWQASIKNNAALQTEENIKYVKIKFPAKLNAQWNGDIYNRLDTIFEYKYTITYVDDAGSINGISFDSILTVTQKNKSSVIDKVYFLETYAYGVGLIEKQQIDIYSTDVDPSIPIEQRVTKGTMFYQKITSYGR